MATSQNTGAFDDVPTAKSVGYGVAAYVVTYVLFFVLKGSQGVQEFTSGFEQGAGSTFEQLGIDPPSAFEIAGWVFYLSHNAGIEISVSAMGQSQSLNMNPGLGNEAYLMAIPPIVLVAAGYLLATRESPAGASLPKVGASLAAGYVILSLVGVFAFAWSATIEGGFGQQATLTVKPQLVMALVVGLVYPAIFGGVGGFIAQSQAPDRQTSAGGAYGSQQGQYGQQGQHGQQSRYGQQPQQGQRTPQGQQPQQGQRTTQGQQPTQGQQTEQPNRGQQDERTPQGRQSGQDDDQGQSDRHR